MRTLQVYYSDPATGILTMGLPNSRAAAVGGTLNLLQNIVLYLRTRPNSDSFIPERGSILGDPLGLSKALRDPTHLKVLISDAVANCQDFIMAQQQNQIQAGYVLTPDETLVQIEVNNIYESDDQTTVFVELLVETQGNKQFFVTV